MAQDLELDFNEIDEEEIVTLLDANGDEVDFVNIAGIALDGKFYSILQPVELMEGMEEDDALVFQVTVDDEGNDSFEIVLDDDVLDAVFAEYNRLLDQANSEE